jgi:hypothetical protein
MNPLNSFCVFSLTPCFSAGFEEASRYLHFPASAAGWKVGGEKIIERVPVLKHGANENPPRYFARLPDCHFEILNPPISFQSGWAVFLHRAAAPTLTQFRTPK